MLTRIERLRMLASLFTRPVFGSLASHGNWQHTFAGLRKERLLVEAEPQPLGEIFEAAWREIRRGYRNEYVYKNEIAGRLLFGKHKPHTASLHIEMPVGNSIVDVAVFNGTSSAYEVKTEFDSARRLETQTSDYLKVFEHVYVVTHPDFAASYAKLVPLEVGVLALLKNGSLSTVRQASSNLRRLDHGSIFRCLRRSEYVSLLESETGHRITLPNGLIGEACAKAFSGLEIEAAHGLYVKALGSRKTDLQNSSFMATLPPSLRAVGCATPLSGSQQFSMSALLCRPVPVALA